MIQISGMLITRLNIINSFMMLVFMVQKTRKSLIVFGVCDKFPQICSHVSSSSQIVIVNSVNRLTLLL